jgi:putative transposase
MSERKAYPTDLKDKEWEQLLPLLPLKRTKPEKMREYINAILYVLRSGCSWRMLPHDFPPWSTVYDVFVKLSRNGTWQRLNNELRAKVRVDDDRNAEPSVLIGDSQSVKTTEKGAHVVLMVANRSKDANDTLSLIPKDG